MLPGPHQCGTSYKKKYPGILVKTGIFLVGNIPVKACKSTGIMTVIQADFIQTVSWSNLKYRDLPERII